MAAKDDHVVAHDDGRVLGSCCGISAAFVKRDPGAGVEAVYKHGGGRLGKPGMYFFTSKLSYENLTT